MGERGPTGQADRPANRTEGQDEVIDLRDSSPGGRDRPKAPADPGPPPGWTVTSVDHWARPGSFPASASLPAPPPPLAPHPPHDRAARPSSSGPVAPQEQDRRAGADGYLRDGGPARSPGGRRGAGWLAVALVVMLGAVAGGGLVVSRVVNDPAPSASGAALPADRSIAHGRSSGIAAALAAMSAGLTTHDEARFLSAFDPSDQALLSRQRAVFTAMTLLPMDAVRYSWGAGTAEPPVQSRPSPPDAVATAVDLRYQLRGWDPAAVEDSLPLTFAPVAGRWVVVADQAQRPGGLDIQPYAEPWSVGGIAVVTRPHVLVVGQRSDLAAVQRLAGRLERMVAEVRAVWPEPSWNGKVVVYAMTDPRFVGQWFGRQAASGRNDDPRGKASFVAKVTVLSATGAEQPYQAASPRLIVTPYLLDRSDTYSLSLLRHELTHVATALVGRDPSTWVTEGVAEYTGFKLGGPHVQALQSFADHGLPLATFRAMQRGSWQPRLVGDATSFYDSDAAAVEEDYTDAWLACLYVADRYGDTRLRQLYDAEAQQPVQESLDEVDAVALRSVLHTDRQTFLAAVRSYGLGLSRQVR